MSGADQLEILRRAIERDGQTVILRRPNGTSFVTVTCQAIVRGYRPNELVNGITQQDSKVVMTQDEILAEGWPGDGLGDAWPQNGDRITIAGRTKQVMAGFAFMSGDETVVRIEARVRG